MRAKDLIELLQKYPPETVVCYDDNDFEYGDGCVSAKLEYCTDDDCDVNKRSIQHLTIKSGGKPKHVVSCRCKECFPEFN